MKKHFATALVAMAASLGATHAHAQFSSASGPVTPPLGSEANPYTPWASTQLANGEKQYFIAPAVSGYWFAAPLKHSALGSTLTHSGFQVSLSPSFNNAPLSFTSIQIGSFQGDALSISANGSVITDNFASGSVLNFAANVHSFEVYSRNGSLPVTSSNTLFPLTAEIHRRGIPDGLDQHLGCPGDRNLCAHVARFGGARRHFRSPQIQGLSKAEPADAAAAAALTQSSSTPKRRIIKANTAKHSTANTALSSKAGQKPKRASKAGKSRNMGRVGSTYQKV